MNINYWQKDHKRPPLHIKSITAPGNYKEHPYFEKYTYSSVPSFYGHSPREYKL